MAYVETKIVIALSIFLAMDCAESTIYVHGIRGNFHRALDPSFHGFR